MLLLLLALVRRVKASIGYKIKVVNRLQTLFFCPTLRCMDKQTAIRFAGGARNLAILLGISTQAVYKWREIPEAQLVRLRKFKPGWWARARREKQ